jgi:transposase
MLCVAPRPQLTARQASKVDLLKEQLPDFAAMRQFAMRFRGILRGKDPAKLDAWLNDIRHSGLHALRRFAQVLVRDIDAVRSGPRGMEQWSDGGPDQQAEGA